MSDSTNPKDTVCFTDYALEEYLQGRLSTQRRQELEAHLETCTECAEARKYFAKEAEAIRGALSIATRAATEDCPDDEFVSLYLDNGLNPQDRAAAELHFVSCPRCRARIVSLYRESKSVIEEARKPTAHVPVARRHEAIVLKMPKRKVPGPMASEDSLRLEQGGNP